MEHFKYKFLSKFNTDDYLVCVRSRNYHRTGTEEKRERRRLLVFIYKKKKKNHAMKLIDYN